MRPSWSCICDLGFDKLARVFEIPDRVFQKAGLRLLDEIKLLLWIQYVDLDRQCPAHHIEQSAHNFLAGFRRATTTATGDFDELLCVSLVKREAGRSRVRSHLEVRPGHADLRIRSAEDHSLLGSAL